MSKRRLIKRHRMIRGTRAYDFAKYLSRDDILYEYNPKLHASFSRFYAGTYTKYDLEEISAYVALVKRNERKFLGLHRKLDEVDTVLCNGK